MYRCVVRLVRLRLLVVFEEAKACRRVESPGEASGGRKALGTTSRGIRFRDVLGISRPDDARGA